MILAFIFGIVLTLLIPCIIVATWRKPRFRAFGVALFVHIISISALAMYGGGTGVGTLIIGSMIIGCLIGGPILLLLNWLTRRKPGKLTEDDISQTFG